MNKRGRPKKVAVLDPNNVESVIKQMKSIEFPYKASVSFFGKQYTASGVTILEAIGGLKPLNPRGRAVLTVENNGVKKDRILQPVQVIRLFTTYGLSREVALKNVSLLFEGL